MKKIISLAVVQLGLFAAAVPCLAARTSPVPTVQNLSIVAAANRATPIVLQGSDPKNKPITFRIVSPPLRGAINGTAPNLAYTPNFNYTGADSFTYVVSNGELTSAPATVSIAVKAGIVWFTNSITIGEGNSGTRGLTIAFTTTAPVSDASISWTTVDGTATAGSDYIGTGGTTRFGSPGPGGASSIGVGVIKGDTDPEFNETFLVKFFNPTNLVIVDEPFRVTIFNDDFLEFQLGTAALAPENSTVSLGEPVKLSLTWTHPIGWRQLDSVDLVLVDDGGEILTTRWHEAANAFSLFNPAANQFVRTAEAGSPTRLDSSAATLHLQESTGGGPPGQTVTIDYGLSFKPEAAGRTFSIEAFATDDEGHQQGFESVGTITVLPR